jgi:hypothetical protein
MNVLICFSPIIGTKLEKPILVDGLFLFAWPFLPKA